MARPQDEREVLTRETCANGTPPYLNSGSDVRVGPPGGAERVQSGGRAAFQPRVFAERLCTVAGVHMPRTVTGGPSGISQRLGQLDVSVQSFSRSYQIELQRTE